MKKLLVTGLLISGIWLYPKTGNIYGQTPNILLINIDDLGTKDLAVTGSDYYKTPNIDRLAKSGMIFTNGYASAANCAPSRASLMTGHRSTRHGIYTVGNSERGQSKHRKLIPIKNTVILAKTHPILPKILKENGFQTVHAGKWHLSKNPLEYGFDVNIGGGYSGHPKSYYPPYKNVNLESPQGTHLTDLITEKAIDFVRSAQEPFFLNYAPYAVHTPIQPVKHLLGKYENKPSECGHNNAEYATMIENLDRNIGALIRALEDQNQLKNTLIIFTSDNGGLFGITNQHPLRAGKGSYYEGGIRVPFFFVWEGKIKPGSVSDIPITNLDIFPTILALTGIGLEPFEPDGDNLLPILEGKMPKMKRTLFWHFPIYLQAYNVSENENRDSLFRTRPGSVIRCGDWKLHYYFEDDGTELFNLKTDIGERTNLVNIEKRKARKMFRRLEKIWKKTKAPIPTRLNPEFESP